MPRASFPILETPEKTLTLWKRNLEYLLSNLDEKNIIPDITFNTITATSGAMFGDVAGGNYSEFETDGTFESIGNARAYRDELGDIGKLKVVGVGITDDAAEGTIDFLNSANLSDYLYANYQLNHDVDLNSLVINPHIHWFQAQNQNPNFLLEYRWQNTGDSKVTSWTRIKCNNLAIPYTAGTISQISYTTGLGVPSTDGLSKIVQIRVFRDNANNSLLFGSTDAYTVATPVMSVDIHVLTNTLGSRTEFSK